MLCPWVAAKVNQATARSLAGAVDIWRFLGGVLVMTGSTRTCVINMTFSEPSAVQEVWVLGASA